ncbi:MAG: oxygen-independent coproporphyrinogen III oxidase [Sphingomonas sp.]|nr:oxygen-independent coproporphyrinogen III oxidase [Sphingomonas sp.]
MRQDAIRRYADGQVPRYTSYPTAPHFSPEVDERTYREWLAAVSGDMALSLYLHIPFCRSMCWYCACHTTVTARPAPVSRYVAALAREIEMVAEALPDRMGVGHIHFGGGSPTLLSPSELVGLVALLGSRFAIGEEAEIAIEIDPRSLEAPMIAALAEAGINRASIGVQSFDPVVQRAINRIQSFEMTAAAVEGLRWRGIERINFDLIYGLPGQTIASCLETVDRAVALAPDRIAIFGYAHVPSFKLHQRKIDESMLPDGIARLEQSRAMADALAEAGYRQIGLDHFAKSDDPLAAAAETGALHRNFQGYTTDACPALLGLGSSSIGRLDGGYVQNVVPISEYQKRVMEGRLPVLRGIAVSADDKLRAAVIERLMCDHKVDLERVCAQFGADPAEFAGLPALEPLAADGLIERHGNLIKVTPEARPLVRSVAAAFDSYLGRGQATHSRAA